MLGKARQLRSEFEKETLPHADALYGTAMRLVRNPGDAEDLVQETFLRAYRFWHTFERGTNCRAWLFKILTNAFHTRYQRVRREAETTQAAAEEAATLEPDMAFLSQERAVATRDPEGALVSRMLSDDVQRALEALPPEFRLPVLLCDLEEFSYKEIAEIMNCPVGTVMSRLYRGRRLLQKALHDYAIDQGIIAPRAQSDGTGETGETIDLAAYRQGRKA